MNPAPGENRRVDHAVDQVVESLERMRRDPAEMGQRTGLGRPGAAPVRSQKVDAQISAADAEGRTRMPDIERWNREERFVGGAQEAEQIRFGGLGYCDRESTAMCGVDVGSLQAFLRK